ncbi:hypothetical protein V6N12_060930 [Hibiscus sabdariffa]|uniref:Uncharacterized protein n=1 Tax=Hibiscus sabdariffa TaxID=183260 RepID=A0ABR2DW09_9ROSI
MAQSSTRLLLFPVSDSERPIYYPCALGFPIISWAQKEIQDGYSRSHKEGNTNDKLNSMNKKEIHKQNGNDWATMKHRNRSLMLTVSAEAGTAKTVKGIANQFTSKLGNYQHQSFRFRDIPRNNEQKFTTSPAATWRPAGLLALFSVATDGCVVRLPWSQHLFSAQCQCAGVQGSRKC